VPYTEENTLNRKPGDRQSWIEKEVGSSGGGDQKLQHIEVVWFL